ncbi:hypothetical protein [uncultured Bradyrhizobium sp.]|uniref:hypothetical protein n=1 Tax=uncultured Bradyrhizobium sp. TaxID=199684 RepID=UPI0035CBE2EB
MNVIDHILITRRRGFSEFGRTLLGDPNSGHPDLQEPDRIEHRDRSEQEQNNGQQPNPKTGRSFPDDVCCQSTASRAAAGLI